MTTSAPPFDVYLSYAREDTELVVELQRRIEAMGQRVWRDQTQLTPGGDWQAELTEAIATARMVLFCVGATGLGEWQRDELGLADARARRDPDFLFTAALLPSAQADFPATALPFSLRRRQWLDLRSGVDAGRPAAGVPRAGRRERPARRPARGDALGGVRSGAAGRRGHGRRSGRGAARAPPRVRRGTRWRHRARPPARTASRGRCVARRRGGLAEPGRRHPVARPARDRGPCPDRPGPARSAHTPWG